MLDGTSVNKLSRSHVFGLLRVVSFDKIAVFVKYSPVAQLVERLPVKEDVAGSSPAGGARWDLIYPKIIIMNMPDFSKIAWQLNTALIGAAFSAISLIYDEKYIYYGFITFLFGVVSHFSSTWFEFVYNTEDKRKERARFYYVQVALILIWLVALFLIFLQDKA